LTFGSRFHAKVLRAKLLREKLRATLFSFAKCEMWKSFIIYHWATIGDNFFELLKTLL